MAHKHTGGIVTFLDYNGMFQVYVSTENISAPQHLSSASSSSQDMNRDGTSNDDVVLGNLLSEFRTSVTQLLDLLMSDEFCHPYGTVAGAVA